MILSTSLLNFVGILVIATYMPEVAAGSDEVDEETSLKQAIFLVGLLKSDFAKILRHIENSTDDVNANVTEDANSTCALPPEDFNSTVAINETEVTERVTTPMSSAPEREEKVATLANLLQPRAPVVQLSSWPPLPMPGYLPPLGPVRQANFPEDYRFPYRFNRRRMMPDYYYYDSPVQRRGNFRRQNNANGDLGIDTATTQVQTTINVPSNNNVTSEATTLHVEETTATSATLSTINLLSTSQLPITQPSSESTTELSTLKVVEPSTQSTSQPLSESTIELSTQSIVEPVTQSTTQQSSESTIELSTLTVVDPSTQLVVELSDLSSVKTTTEPSILLMTESSTLLTKPRNRIGVRTHAIPSEEDFTAAAPTQQASCGIRNSIQFHTTFGMIMMFEPDYSLAPVTPMWSNTRIDEATTAVISNRFEQVRIKNADSHQNQLRQHKDTTEKSPTEDVEMSQIASELIKELKGTRTEHITNIPKIFSTKVSKRSDVKKTHHKTTMKVYLKGSSRLPVPLPENNAFCYAYPHNSLCGTM